MLFIFHHCGVTLCCGDGLLLLSIGWLVGWLVGFDGDGGVKDEEMVVVMFFS